MYFFYLNIKVLMVFELCFIWEISDFWLKIQKPEKQAEYMIL